MTDRIEAWHCPDHGPQPMFVETWISIEPGISGDRAQYCCPVCRAPMYAAEVKVAVYPVMRHEVTRDLTLAKGHVRREEYNEAAARILSALLGVEAQRQPFPEDPYFGPRRTP